MSQVLLPNELTLKIASYLEPSDLKSYSLVSRQWTTLLGTSSDDFAYSVATDDSGNIYVVGITNGNLNGNVNAGGSDIFLTKYDSSGRWN